MKRDIQKLEKQVLTASQTFAVKTSNKRVIERTPDEGSKRISRGKGKYAIW